ncbi:Uma2 family endonuclease [Paenibacillus cremeus]|uniref:Uma2 family endonuclease n=1 Tax=Paenibacillus cremeus TaxID=2163881 RepID=A0A559K6K5_9BACL|nr:Uma2 family endonuclease [Paenibacillus cremeus]TVY07768.1 Uma2 family endonuclease [Paenibacillus cremeus]
MKERKSEVGAKPERVKEQVESYEYVDRPAPNPYVEERYEIIEGVRYDLSPAPTILHQKIAAQLYLALHSTCHANGTILFSPIDVYLDEDNCFQPDLVMVLHEREHIITPARIEGAPDLVVEILSPSTSTNDKIRKKRQFEKHGVTEYWIADPTHFTIDQFVLVNGEFVLHESYGAGIGDVLTSERFTCIHIELDKLFGAVK